MYKTRECFCRFYGTGGGAQVRKAGGAPGRPVHPRERIADGEAYLFHVAVCEKCRDKGGCFNIGARTLKNKAERISAQELLFVEFAIDFFKNLPEPHHGWQ